MCAPFANGNNIQGAHTFFQYKGGSIMKFLKKIDYNSPVILTFTFVSFFVLLLNYATSGVSNNLLFSTYRSPISDPLMYVRLFGHVLGHANWEHYIGNMLLFLVVGPQLEERYGSKKLLVMIIITAVVTGLLNSLLFANVAVVGASGVVFMLILLSSVTSIKEDKIPLTLILVAIAYIGREITNGIVSKDSISQLSHIAGGVCGCLFGYFFNRNITRKSKKQEDQMNETDSEKAFTETQSE